MNEVFTIDLADKHCKIAWPECAGTTHCMLTELSFHCHATFGVDVFQAD